MGIIQLFIQWESWKKSKDTYTKQLICVHWEFIRLQSKIRTLNKALTCKQSKFSQLLTKSRNSYLFYNGLQEHPLKSFTDFIYFPYPKLCKTNLNSLISTVTSKGYQTAMVNKNLSGFSTDLYRKIHCASLLAVALMQWLTQCSVLSKPICFTI